MSTTAALSRFAEIASNRHQYALDWQARTGGKVLGYLCTYTPEEIINAAGLLPVRIFGSGAYPAESETYMGLTWCAFSRDCLAEGLRGRYDYLEGLVYSNSCYHMMQTFDAWRRHVPTKYANFIDLPWDIDATTAVATARREFGRLRDTLSSYLGQPIEDSAIERSIEIFDENRRLLRELYALRKTPTPSITGAEVLQVIIANQVMDKAEHTELLRQLLDELRGRQLEAPKLRLMISGSEIDDPEIIQLIESLDAMVVADDQCTGSRYFWNETPSGEDALERIARRQMSRPPCPFKDVRVPRRRVSHLVPLAKEYQVDGVVFMQQRFCESHGWDTPYLQKALEKEGIPSLVLEVTIPNAVGPMRTRLEAFIETLVLDLA
jgi:benzoyl-CoA reductase subunit C